MKSFFVRFYSKIVISIFLCNFLMVGDYSSSFAQGEDIREYELKAYFIYTFIKYIEWVDSEKDSTFTIGVIGSSKLVPPLEKIADRRLVKNKKIVIKKWDRFEEIGECHILFITESQKNNLRRITEKLKGKSVLTIGDTKGFIKKGICINFTIADNAIKFEISRNAMERSRLKVSSQLLKLAILID